MFDEYLEPPHAERLVSPAQAVQALVNSADTPSSTTIDQDVPSPSISSSSLALQSHSLHQGVAAESTFMEDILVAPVDNNPFINTVPRTPQQNDVVKKRNRTLVEAVQTMLIFSKALMFLWAEAVATACYTKN
uniref:Putative ribonuclease H-like domain-containing protein n=1 Tax=Tanacetum cinerariifolium TaxID=118510 RepID=A0A6L2NFH8_TANCI|nr:putative ribonuclease H-like domain-containing protein [Tanacetum cinerariifolium]